MSLTISFFAKNVVEHLVDTGIDLARVLARPYLLDGSLCDIIRLVVHDIEQDAFHIVVQRTVLSYSALPHALQQVSPQAKRHRFSDDCSCHSVYISCITLVLHFAAKVIRLYDNSKYFVRFLL